MSKKYLKLITISLILFLMFIIFLNSIRIKNSNLLIEVKKGETFHHIANKLKRKDIIQSKFLFILLAKISGQSRKLKTGTYKFDTIKTIPGIINTLTKGKITNKVFTVIEGYNIFQIADIVDKKKIVKKNDFFNAVKNKSILDKFNINQKNAEGFLYPDTYYVPYEITAEKLVEIMIGNFFNHIDTLYLDKLKKKYGSIEKGIILASLVEWEAKVDFERPLIAGVFLNRIKKNLNLASCATVLYALNKHKNRLLFKDLKINSPYNTYLYKGLPPSPICNPSEKSILAVIYPAKSNYLFFVSMQNGRHYFAATYKQHLKAYRYFILNEKNSNPFVM